jgi:hypothetical protein
MRRRRRGKEAQEENKAHKPRRKNMSILYNKQSLLLFGECCGCTKNRIAEKGHCRQ